MIVTVTPSPAVDYTIELGSLERGETNRTTSVHRRWGGKGVNVARVLAQLGEPAAAVLPITAAEREDCAKDLPGVECRFLETAEAARSTFAIVETLSGTATVISQSGRAHPPTTWSGLVPLVFGGGARCVVMSGSTPEAFARGIVGDVVQTARQAGVPVVVDMVGAALREASDAGADLIVPNRAEICDATGLEDPIAAAKALQSRGAGLVVVTLGAEGLVVVPPGSAQPAVWARLDRQLVGNPTGAGDAAAAAAAVWCAAGGTSLVDLARSMTSWSAAAVLSALAGTLDRSVEQLADHVLLSTDGGEPLAL